MCRSGLLSIIVGFADTILGLLIAVLIIYVVISWLYAFDVVSRRNSFVNAVWEFCRRLTDPILRPIRRVIPPIAGVDLSVLLLILIIQLVRQLLPWLHNVIVGCGNVL
jgi:YggT family protein